MLLGQKRYKSKFVIPYAGVSEKTFARYENLSVRQSRSMDRLLRILDNYPNLLVEISQKPQNTSEVAITPDHHLNNCVVSMTYFT